MSCTQIGDSLASKLKLCANVSSAFKNNFVCVRQCLAVCLLFTNALLARCRVEATKCKPWRSL